MPRPREPVPPRRWTRSAPQPNLQLPLVLPAGPERRAYTPEDIAWWQRLERGSLPLPDHRPPGQHPLRGRDALAVGRRRQLPGDGHLALPGEPDPLRRRAPRPLRYTPDSLVLFDPILFTGKPRDVESGIDYFGARFYSNRWCRWLSADQPVVNSLLGEPGSWNLFSFCASDPINNHDPDGFKTYKHPGWPRWEAVSEHSSERPASGESHLHFKLDGKRVRGRYNINQDQWNSEHGRGRYPREKIPVDFRLWAQGQASGNKMAITPLAPAHAPGNLPANIPTTSEAQPMTPSQSTLSPGVPANTPNPSPASIPTTPAGFDPSGALTNNPPPASSQTLVLAVVALCLAADLLMGGPTGEGVAAAAFFVPLVDPAGGNTASTPSSAGQNNPTQAEKSQRQRCHY